MSGTINPNSGTTVITAAGIAAAARAGLLGAQLQLSGFQIGSDLITPVSSMTTGVYSGGVAGAAVYTGNISTQVTYQVLSDSSMLYTITLDETVGPFTVGNIGLFISNGAGGSGQTLFSITALPSTSSKYPTNLPTVGNRQIYNIQIILGGVANIMNVTLMTQTASAVPVVANKAALPAASSAPYPLYMILSDSDYGGVAALALRNASSWSYIPIDTGWASASVNGNIISLSSNLFGNTVNVGQAVYFDTNAKQFLLGDVTVASRVPLGLRGANNTLITTGGLYVAGSPTYTAGTQYFADGNPNYGGLTVTQNSYPFGYALSTQSFLVTAGGTGGSGGNGSEYESVLNPFFYM